MASLDPQQVLWHLDDFTLSAPVVDAISMGADVNMPDPKTGRSPLMVFVEDVDFRGAGHAKIILRKLLEAGANPLGGDCAVHRAISNECGWQVDMMAKHAIDHDLRSDDGETIFHILAQMLRDEVGATMLVRAISMAQERGAGSCIHAIDDQGNTPLHMLWREGYCIDLDDCDVKEAGDEAIEAHWLSTVGLWEAGCDLALPNGDGESVVDLIRVQHSRGFSNPEPDPYHDAFKRALRACQEHKTLTQDTAPGRGVAMRRRV